MKPPVPGTYTAGAVPTGRSWLEHRHGWLHAPRTVRNAVEYACAVRGYTSPASRLVDAACWACAVALLVLLVLSPSWWHQ